ncbi:hypothetical protein HME9304_02374 [Flagellimonas maritima]|uniref:Gliding motility-associated C-terminal domain-containing protein n=1 Tax=Flagellimonas maritima TaxID=1383885 RepID=A0A2Z4LTY7_9FLAO|nr:gliding motility-associated C-terminal domain-containing protein [Allomuricauda aurantiaca]AWX45361.1 hypothetical protein HME9304_02374 [Allomuricauda aurantiaca]
MFKNNQHRGLRVLGLMFMIFNLMSGQDAFHNFGNLQFHGNTSVGFHIDLIDDGVFDENLGLTGFYSENQLNISGTSNPVFNDIEIVTENGLYLNTWVGIKNNANFIIGNVLTDKSSSGSYLNFIDDAFFTGTGELTHVNGYAGATNKELITFPVGDGQQLRYLTLTSDAINSLARCAYYREDPNNSTSLGQQFDTANKEFDDLQISEFEFWRLESSQPSAITLTWNVSSNISLLTESTEGLLVVGWNKTENRWESLGNTSITGNLESGNITSNSFLPNDYEIVTLGGTESLLETFSVLELDNYFMTPNNDGTNDFLEIDGIENFPNNILNIYNRYGILVYSKLNYNNEFDGKSNQNAAISRNSGLAAGVYFYVLTLTDSKEKFQGYLYLSQ